MSAKRLAILVVSVLVLVGSAMAQVNEISITAGRTFVSTQTIANIPVGQDNHLHFGNEETVAFNYGRLLKSRKIFGLYAELPVAIYPRMDVHSFGGLTPKDIGALFVTPSVRLNVFSGDSVSPWVSAGGGYGRFREAPTLTFGLPNPGATGTNTGVIQFGAGMDVWFWQRWGARFEARDFYSGIPAYNVVTGKSRQHNFYVGAGVTHRF
jgi:hypothetical protein